MVKNWTPVLPRTPPPSGKPGQFEYACAVDRIMAGVGGDFTLEVSTTAAEGMGDPCDGGMVLTQGSGEIDFDDSGIMGVRPPFPHFACWNQPLRARRVDAGAVRVDHSVQLRRRHHVHV